MAQFSNAQIAAQASLSPAQNIAVNNGQMTNPIATQNNAIQNSVSNTTVGGNTITPANPHDVIGYNPATDPTSTAFNKTAANSATGSTPAPTTNAPNVAQQPNPQNPTGAPASSTNASAQQVPQSMVDQVGKIQQGINSLKDTQTKGLAIAQNSGVKAPQDQAAGISGAQTATSNVPKPGPTTSPAVDNFFQSNATVQQSSQSILDFLSPQQTQTDLFAQMQKVTGDQAMLSQEKFQLMNYKNIMSGTPDDIRSEITAANGFATDSQVQALAVSRNSTLLKQATFLQDQIGLQQDAVANDTSLLNFEKDMANTQFNQRMSVMQYVQTNQNNMQNAARSAIDALIKTPGGLSAYASDPQMAANAEKIMGYAPGTIESLSKAATEANSLDVAQKKASINASNASAAKSVFDMQSSTPGTVAYNKNQDKLEQQYRTVLTKEASSRSGDLGIQNQKVSQAIHLTSLLNQYKDTKGNYNVPTAQYAELAMGLANLLSPSGSAESDRQAIMSKTAQSGLAGALQYITGTPQNGNTQAVIKNLVDSIDRQGSTAQDLRDQSVQFLQGLAPTGLDQSRIDALNKNSLPSYTTYKNTGTVGGKQTQVPQVIAPAMIPSGYYQASDGLLYKK